MSDRTERRVPGTGAEDSQTADGSRTVSNWRARVEGWLREAETRHLADLEFREVSRALRALSSTYVERRAKLSAGGALAGNGKRAAFALFYAPLHLLLVEHIVRSIGRPFTAVNRVLDLGCGSGASAAGWALACERAIDVTGIDRHRWAIDEAKQTFRALGLRGTFRVDDMTKVLQAPHQHGRERHGRSRGEEVKNLAILAAFAVNELADAQGRSLLLTQMLDHAEAGGHCLVIEPLAGGVAPWWSEWRRTFVAAGGRADEWRVRTTLPAIVEKLDRAAGLDHRELTARSLAI